MRRNDRETGLEEADEILAKGIYGVLSMNGTAGPYGVPICHAVAHGTIYFHCAGEGRKLDHLRADDRVSFCVVDAAEPLPAVFSMRYRSVIVSGRAVEVKEREEKLQALGALVLKYSGVSHAAAGRKQAEDGLERTAVYRIKPETLTGKARR